MERPRAPGTRLGPFALVRWLGEGTGGEVWEARFFGPAGFEKPVALKLLRERHGLEALQREARFGALLHHPNVVGTLHLGEYAETWCVALELVRGMSVDHLCSWTGGRLPPRAVADVGVQAAAGLEHIHAFEVDGVAAGLLHRDIKPSNLLVDRDGLVKVADFGVSIAVGEPGAVAGTPGFMAPEQRRGAPEPRSDLFSLGAVLYAISTGVRPFGRGAGAHAAIDRVEELLASPSFLRPVDDAVPGLGEIVRACLRHDPRDRPASAGALGLALARLGARLPGPALRAVLAATSLSPGVRSPAPGTGSPRGNVPPARDLFVGRQAELAHVESQVRLHPWVALTGLGGVGKTRLALEVARRLSDLPGGAWFVGLAEARTEQEVCGSTAAVLGIDLDGPDAAQQIGRALAARGQAVVVLDNLEGCADALPGTLGRWLAQATDTAFLGTSRVVPGLVGERVVRVGELAPEDAAHLFRARAPRALGEDEQALIEPLCRALEGIPLSIELAAARAGVLEIGAIGARLSLALLAGTARDRPERHRSVSASLAWSVDLLSEGARRGLSALSVFEGSFDLAAAEAVLRAPNGLWAIDVLHELSNASLVEVDAARDRFRLRVVVREFAATLQSPEAAAAAEERHGAHYARSGSRDVVARFHGPDGGPRRARVALDIDNLVSACRRAVARGAGPVALATLQAADVVLVDRGPVSLRVDLALAVASADGLAPTDRARAAFCAGVALYDAGRSDASGRWFETALAQYRAQGDAGNEGIVLGGLGILDFQAGRVTEAEQQWARAIALVRQDGMVGEEARLLTFLGNVHLVRGQYGEALAVARGALERFRSAGDPRGEAVALNEMGIACVREGLVEEALALHEQARQAWQDAGDRRGVALATGNVALAQVELGRPDEALVEYEQALSGHRAAGSVRGEAMALTNYGSLLRRLGRLGEARTHLERALAVHRAVVNRSFEGTALGVLGEVALDDGNVDAAQALFEQALEIHRALGNRAQEGTVLGHLGRLHERAGRRAEAMEHFHAALDRVRETGHRGALAALLGAYARALIAHDVGSASAVLDEAFQQAGAASSSGGSAGLLLVRAELEVHEGRTAAARATLEQVVALAPWDVPLVREAQRLRAAAETEPDP